MVDYPTGGEWALLYSSAANGFSLNRFLHHCSDYRGPSVTLFTYKDEDDTEHLVALAVDVEWRYMLCVCKLMVAFNWTGLLNSIHNGSDMVLRP